MNEASKALAARHGAVFVLKDGRTGAEVSRKKLECRWYDKTQEQPIGPPPSRQQQTVRAPAQLQHSNECSGGGAPVPHSSQLQVEAEELIAKLALNLAAQQGLERKALPPAAPQIDSMMIPQWGGHFVSSVVASHQQVRSTDLNMFIDHAE